jgi:segregation and condensation protein A
LIEIKSKMLLPRNPNAAATDEEIEDPRKELVERLLEYEQFKNAAQMLYERSTVEQAVFPRGAIESDENNSEVSATVFDLFNAFEKICARRKEVVAMEIKREEMSLAEMIKNLKRKIFSGGKLNLLKFFEAIETRGELVLAFVAVLEIVRTESVRLVQNKTFGDIILLNADE